MEDLKKLAGGASALFNRAVQYTGEKLGTAEHTDLDAHFEQLLQRADKTKAQTEVLLKCTETLLHPDPTARAEDYLYDKLERTGLEKKRQRLSNLTQLGGTMLEASAAYGPGSSYGNVLLKVGQTEQKLGDCEKTFVSTATTEYLQPLKAFLDTDMKNITKERRALEVKRLDLDAAKSKLKRAKSEKGKSDAESELRHAQSEFDRQAETTKLLLEGVNKSHEYHTRCLNSFVEAQANYYASCHQYMQDLQRQLGSNNAKIVGGGASGFSQSAGSTAMYAAGSAYLNNSYDHKVPGKGGFASLCNEPVTQRAKVLYDYEANSAGELSLTADEIITVWTSDSSDWMMAERAGQKGRVPMSYIEIIRI